ncbi:dimethyl sulfoxide reductase anchor subunit [Paracoccaceae bacterium]
MHPAPSVIVFTVLSGLGFGFLAFLGLGAVPGHGTWHFALWVLGYALAVGGLLASTFHLGNSQRALLAFTQWRSSWLSREGCAAVATLIVLAPVALSDLLPLGNLRVLGVLGAGLCVITLFTTSMIYAQLKSVPRWNHPVTPLLFLTYALAGGAILAGQGRVAVVACLMLFLVLAASWRIGDRRFAEVGQSIGSATGLGSLGKVRVFERGHTAGNYLLQEMIFVVGRKHAQRLRIIALAFSALIPALLLLLGGGHWPVVLLAVLCHILGALAQRWLFFAQAEHVVGLYYGMR